MLEVKQLRTGYGGMDVIHGIDISSAPARSSRWWAPTAPQIDAGQDHIGPDAGAVGRDLVRRQRIDRLSPTARVLLGIARCPRAARCSAASTVAENLRLGAYVHRRSLSEAELQARMREVCERFPILLERMGEVVGNLSGGSSRCW